MMEAQITLSLDDEPVRFTPDGRISVLDAIRVLTLSECPELIWEDLKKRHPELLEHCGDHRFQQEGPLPVMDSAGWDLMWVLLFDYVLEPDRFCKQRR
ncbi:MAG: hypothetical protein AB1512_31950 [Thermodesulfobacteriota bacterium]